MDTEETRDVTVYHADGRTEEHPNVSQGRSRELENLITDPTIPRVDSVPAAQR